MHVGAPSPSGTILIVDDDPDIAEMMCLFLEAEGYEVASARNGELGLAALRDGAHGASLILLDLMMPVMDGWRFYKELQLHPDLRQIPVVVMTADFRAVARASELGISAVLKKPFDASELLGIVRTYVPSSRAAS